MVKSIFTPSELPRPSRLYPGPWTAQNLGNGHWYIFDSKDRLFAHIYCYDDNDEITLESIMNASNLIFLDLLPNQKTFMYYNIISWENILIFFIIMFFEIMIIIFGYSVIK
jgi:hypothetical protein